MNYKWKMASFARHVDIDAAMDEIRKAELVYGKITTESVLNIARDKSSALHGLFEWDDSKAAEKYRLQQAMTIINNIEVVIVSDGGSRNIPFFEIVRTSDDGSRYKPITELDYDEVKQVRDATLKMLDSAKVKLSVYKNFESIIPLLDSTIGELRSCN